MGVLTFSRPPQEALGQIQSALEVMTLVHEIAHNPAMGDVIDELSQRLATAQELSDDKKQQLRDAEEVIAQSHEFLEEFDRAKTEHAKKIQTDFLEIQNKTTANQRMIDEYVKDKAALQSANEKAKKDAEEKLAKSKQYYDEASARALKADKMEKDLAAAKESHLNEVGNFERDRIAAISEMDAREKAHAANVQNLAKDKAAFEARKKKFEDAMRE